MGLANKLNQVLSRGDKIRVKAGKDSVDGKGSFIEAAEDYLVWSDDEGDILYTHLGDVISVKKV